MPAPIQTLPQGLLGLLQLKASGMNPTDLLLTVQPDIDLTAWWMNRVETDICQQFGGNTTVTITANATGIFGPASLVVPANETWYVTNFTLLANLLATEDLVVSGAFTFPGSASAVYGLGPCVVEPTDATARARQVVWNAGPFWLQPGAKLQAAIHDIKTAATITINFGVRGAVIPI